MKSLISVLIPSYNHHNYVQDTIKSIINQSYENIELIAVDDGSCDLTFQKINEMRTECEKRFKRVHFETKENEGTVATFNRLLSLAKGDYILIIASDDALYDKDALKIQAEFLDKHKKYVLVACDNIFMDSNGKICYRDEEHNIVYDKNKAAFKTFGNSLQKGMQDIVNFKGKNFGSYETFLRINYIPNGYLIRKSALDKTGGFKKEAPLEDYWLHLQLSKLGRYKYIDKPLFLYRWHGTNSIKNIEKMEKFTELTRNFEIEQVLKNGGKFEKYVKRYLNYGALIKIKGVPFVFEIKKYKNETGKKTKFITILGFEFKL